jgi:hypothetical protein
MTNVYVRLLVYTLSTLLGSVPAVALGWFSYQFVDGLIQITINLEGAVTALLVAVGLSGGVFKLWGTK